MGDGVVPSAVVRTGPSVRKSGRLFEFPTSTKGVVLNSPTGTFADTGRSKGNAFPKDNPGRSKGIGPIEDSSSEFDLKIYSEM